VCLAGPEHRSVHAKISSALAEKDFECGWRQRFRTIPRLKSSVTSSIRKTFPNRIAPSAGSRCAALQPMASLSRTDLLPEVTITAEGVCAGIRSEPRMPIRLLRAIFFRWSNPSQLSGTLSIRREKTRTSWQESLTAAERQRQSNCLSRLGKQRLEEPLLGGGLPQGIVAIDMRR